jgi:hypothetical protein
MAKEAKALFAKCPKCAAVAAQLVESYKVALKTGNLRSFSCPACKTEYFARTEQVSCGVTHELTPQAHPLRVNG